MLDNLKELLRNTNLQEKIKIAFNQATVVDLLLIAGAEKGYVFTVESIVNLLSELNTLPQELSEDELLVISGAAPSITCHTWWKCSRGGCC